MTRHNGPFFGRSKGIRPTVAKQLGEMDLLSVAKVRSRTRRKADGTRIKTFANDLSPLKHRRVRVDIPDEPRKPIVPGCLAGLPNWVYFNFAQWQDDYPPDPPCQDTRGNESPGPYYRMWGDSCGNAYHQGAAYGWAPVPDPATANDCDRCDWLANAELAAQEDGFFAAPPVRFFSDPRPIDPTRPRDVKLLPTDTKNNIFYFAPLTSIPVFTGDLYGLTYMHTGFPEFDYNLTVQMGEQGSASECSTEYNVVSKRLIYGLNYGYSSMYGFYNPHLGAIAKADMVDQSEVLYEGAHPNPNYTWVLMRKDNPAWSGTVPYSQQSWRFTFNHLTEHILGPVIGSPHLPAWYFYTAIRTGENAYQLWAHVVFTLSGADSYAEDYFPPYTRPGLPAIDWNADDFFNTDDQVTAQSITQYPTSAFVGNITITPGTPYELGWDFRTQPDP